MDSDDSTKFIQLPNSEEDTEDITRQLVDEVTELRQINEQMANTLEIQKELIQQLRDEIARLKGQKPKPKIRSSKLEGPKSKPNWRKRIGLHDGLRKIVLFSTWVKRDFASSSAHTCFSSLRITESFQYPLKITRLARRVIKKVKRLGKPGQPRGKPRQKKKTILRIHQERVVHPDGVPEGAKFKGYNRYTVQELTLRPHNIQYKLARWQLPDGRYITGELPKTVQGHYGPELVVFILHQYYVCRVTEHLLLDQLRARGILISAGQLNNILIENKVSYMEEVAEILPLAAMVEGQIQADDTGGRHKGQNQYTTVIGNRWFSAFTTTDSKSRVNFLKLLHGGKEEYLLNEDTLDYLSQMKVPSYLLGYVSLCLGSKFAALGDWERFLRERNITQKTEVRFLTEAALYASLIKNGIPRNLGVHSDDAGQFDVFIRSLCWIHEERHYRKLIMTTDESRADLKRVEDQIWDFYRKLQTYKDDPTEAFRQYLDQRFDDIFQQQTSSSLLNHQLKKTWRKKSDLLRVLERPETPLHNNASETDARSAKIKLKISGGTRSDTGQRARDTFLSLQQTCRKLGINFIIFLQDRARGLYEIPRLAQIIYDRASESFLDPSALSCKPVDLDPFKPPGACCHRLVG